MKVIFIYNIVMTKAVKNRILYQLNLLKSFGFDYHNNVDFGNNIVQSSSDLPNNMQELDVIVQNCYLCDLSKSRKNILFGQGSTSASLLFLNDAPSESEDKIGTYFQGKSGELLRKMIENVLNLTIDEVYITNIVKCKGNNGFNKNHVESCSLYLQKQIELINPKLIITLGEKAYKYLTNDSTAFEKVRGNILSYKYYNILPTFSPSILLRNPSLKKEAYFDMLKIKSILETS